MAPLVLGGYGQCRLQWKGEHLTTFCSPSLSVLVSKPCLLRFVRSCALGDCLLDLNHNLQFCQVSRSICGSIALNNGGCLHPVCSAQSSSHKAVHSPCFWKAMYCVQPLCIQQKAKVSRSTFRLACWVLLHRCQIFWTDCFTLLHVALHLFFFLSSFSFICFFCLQA